MDMSRSITITASTPGHTGQDHEFSDSEQIDAARMRAAKVPPITPGRGGVAPELEEAGDMGTSDGLGADHTFGQDLLEAVKVSLNKQIDDIRHQMHCLESDRARFVTESAVATFNAYAAGTGYGEDFVVEASGSTMAEALERACSQEHRVRYCDWNLDGRVKTIAVSVKLPHTEVSIPFGVYEHSIPVKMLPWAREAAKRP